MQLFYKVMTHYMITSITAADKYQFVIKTNYEKVIRKA